MIYQFILYVSVYVEIYNNTGFFFSNLGVIKNGATPLALCHGSNPGSVVIRKNIAPDPNAVNKVFTSGRDAWSPLCQYRCHLLDIGYDIYLDA